MVKNKVNIIEKPTLKEIVSLKDFLGKAEYTFCYGDKKVGVDLFKFDSGHTYIARMDEICNKIVIESIDTLDEYHCSHKEYNIYKTGNGHKLKGKALQTAVYFQDFVKDNNELFEYETTQISNYYLITGRTKRC